MANGSFFIQRPEDALRHVNTLVKGLKKIAVAGWVGGGACTLLALFLSHYLVSSAPASGTPGSREISGVLLVAWFMALAMLFFSTMYYIAGWGMSRQKEWARYTAAAAFLLKLILCVWLGRGSFGAMIVFLLIAAWDIYGLWVLLSKETGQLFTSSQSRQAQINPANLAT